MAKSKYRPTPKFKTLNELVGFFDTHDMGNYWDKMPEAHFDIDIRRRTHVIALDDDIVRELDALTEAKQVPSQTLVNSWLREKLAEQTKAA